MGSGAVPRQHRVELYEDSRALAERVAAFLARRLVDGGAAAAVARPGHLATIEAELSKLVDVDGLRDEGRLRFIDAPALLESFMHGLAPLRDRFRDSVCRELAMLRSSGSTVHVYGEMVDLLWESGERDAAIQLESLWCELLAEQPISLLCGYRLDRFGWDLEGFSQVCDRHDDMDPVRRHAVLAGHVEVGHALVTLEQRTRALELEIERRRLTEQRMRELLVVTREMAAAAERSAIAEKQARGDIELLYELIATANRLSVDELYTFALRGIMRATSSDRSAILLFDRDGVIRFKAWEGLSESYRSAVEGHTAWTPEQLYPAPVLVADTETDNAWEAYRGAFRAEGIRALAFVPIINHHRQLIGKLVLYRDEARTFSLRDIQLTSTVAVHIAQAVERKRKEREIARAYREERDARMLADEATRAREEILSVVSHDLRNPLGAIMMSATAVLHVSSPDDNPRVYKSVARIQRQAERMARYIRDLVDFGSIESGRIAIERGEHKPETIITAASELFGPIATERGLKFETRIWPDLPVVQCDSDRAVQVLTSLVANALKVTPKGGAVSIGAETKNNDVVFYVRDTGPGIDAAELPNLFERHFRGKSTPYKGAGLGLSIARGIVDAHGGKIWAESRPGVGSTFYFSLSQEN